MQFRDAVATIRITQGQDGHAKSLTPVLLVPCQIDELVAAQAKLGPEIGKIFIHQPEREFIVPGRDGRMSGKNIAVACFGNGLLEGLALGHVFAGPFKCQEGRVALIHVPDVRL